jgi:flagellar L-ring protein precursor FlgH
MKSFCWILLIAGLIGLAAAPAKAGSIWAKANAAGVMPRLYEDDTARRTGDVVTIIINERSNIDNTTKRKNEKKADRSVTASGTVDLKSLPKLWGGSDKPDPFTLPSISATSNASTGFEGNADLKAQRNLTDRITVTVHDVLPNGNLVVVGSRQRNVYGDIQMVCVSGIVRPSDITFANTVNSEQVADFQMISMIKGPENLTTKPGWLGRILNFVSPW